MKIKQYLLALLVSGVALMGANSLTAQEEAEDPAADAAISAAIEQTMAPAKAAVEAIKMKYGEDSDQAGYAQSYIDLLEGQGEWAYAFDFFTISMLWTVIAAALVFLMHLGFATLEAGLTQSKNTVNILFKNVFIISIGLVTYALCGFNTHYPLGSWIIEGWLSWGSAIGDLNDGANNFGYGGTSLARTGFGDFIFQAFFVLVHFFESSFIAHQFVFQISHFVGQCASHFFHLI